MQQVDPDDPRLRGRPVWGMAILLLPVIGVVLTILAYAGIAGLGFFGRPAAGQRVELVFAGCPEAAAVVGARLADMGLAATPVAVPEGFAFGVVLPEDADVAERIPRTLTVPGALEIRGDGALLATGADVVEASVRMDLMMVPSTLLRLRPEGAQRVTAYVRAHPDGRIDFLLDGTPIGTQSNRNPVAVGDLEIAPMDLGERDRWLAVAEWSVTIDHPLPCAVTGAPARPPAR